LLKAAGSAWKKFWRLKKELSKIDTNVLMKKRSVHKRTPSGRTFSAAENGDTEHDPYRI